MLGYNLYEKYTSNDSAHEMATGYISQSFTPGTSHKLHYIRFLLYDAGHSGNATISLFEADANGKPTGAAIATGTVAYTNISTTDYVWAGAELSVNPIVTNKKLVATLHSAGTELWARMDSGGTYGEAFSSTDGVTWTAAPGTICFEEWGVPLPTHGTYPLPLYPTAAGNYTGLSGTFADVDDLMDSPDDSNGVKYDVGPNFLTGVEGTDYGRLTGTTALWKSGVAGLFGTGFVGQVAVGDLCRTPTNNEFYGGGYRIGVVLSVGPTGITFTKVLGGFEGFVTGGQLENAWFCTPETLAKSINGMLYLPDDNVISHLPLAKIDGTWTSGPTGATASGGNALAVYPDPYFLYNFFGIAWYGSGGSIQRNTQQYHLKSVDSNDAVTYTNTGASKSCVPNECGYCSLTWVDDLTSEDTQTQWCSPTKKSSFVVKSTQNKEFIHSINVRFRVKINHTQHGAIVILMEDSVNEDNPLILPRKVRGKLTVADTTYFKAGDRINLTDTEGHSENHVVFRVFSGKIYTVDALTYLFLAPSGTYLEKFTQVTNLAAVTITGTARPFIRLDGVESLGTEVTITATEEDCPHAIPVRAGTEYNFGDWLMTTARVWEYNEIISRPGGGVFTQDDFLNSKFEVGIELGNLSDLANPVSIECTQLLAIGNMSATSQNELSIPKSGWEDYGFLVFETPTINGVSQSYDALGLPVMNGYNTLGWKTYQFPVGTSSSDLVAKPVVISTGGRNRVIYGNNRPKIIYG